MIKYSAAAISWRKSFHYVWKTDLFPRKGSNRSVADWPGKVVLRSGKKQDWYIVVWPIESIKHRHSHSNITHWIGTRHFKPWMVVFWSSLCHVVFFEAISYLISMKGLRWKQQALFINCISETYRDTYILVVSNRLNTRISLPRWSVKQLLVILA